METSANKKFKSLLNQFSLNEKEANSYFKILLLSIPIYIYFILKTCNNSALTNLTLVFGLYTLGMAMFLFLTCNKNIGEKLGLSLGLMLLYAYFEKLSLTTIKSPNSIIVFITIIYIMALCALTYNRYYNLITYKDNPQGLIMYGKKYAVLKFKSEFIASCIKVKENATRSSIRRDINNLYERIKHEKKDNVADTGISKEKVGKNNLEINNDIFHKGVVYIAGGIGLPICDFNSGTPAVFINGLNNPVANTLEYARKSKVGTDINGHNYIYPITPYLDHNELEKITDADNLLMNFKEDRLKVMSKDKILASVTLLEQVIARYNEYNNKVKNTLDEIKKERIETEIEMELRHEIEHSTSALNIYKCEASLRENEKPEDARARESYYGSRAGRAGIERRSTEKFPVGEDSNNEPILKTKREVFAEGMEELENLVGLFSIKDEIKQYVNKYKLDSFANQMGLPIESMLRNFVFVGSLGVGKTTVAKILAKLLFGLGCLRNYDVYEINKSVLSMKTVEERENMSRRVVNEVTKKGCMLLIEDFHQLLEEKEGMGETLKILADAICNNNEKISCVITGKGENIAIGLKDTDFRLESKFPVFLHFENYKSEELVKIFETSFCGKRYSLNHDSREALRRNITNLVDMYTDFSNASDVRKIFDKAIHKQASRLAGKEDLSKDKLMLINKEDIEKAIQEFSNEKNRG